jgi:hypothetical protein
MDSTSTLTQYPTAAGDKVDFTIAAELLKIDSRHCIDLEAGERAYSISVMPGRAGCFRDTPTLNLDMERPYTGRIKATTVMMQVATPQVMLRTR